MFAFLFKMIQTLLFFFKDKLHLPGAVDTYSYSENDDDEPAQLTEAVLAGSSQNKMPGSTAEYSGRHPLAKRHRNMDFTKGSRAFGSKRANTTRIHAGCDLYAPVGSKVYAIDDGVVLHYYEYYSQTWALVVQHGDIVVLYGEVQPPKDAYKSISDRPDPAHMKGLPNGVGIGAKVYKDQHIAYVGQLRFLSTTTNKRSDYRYQMLHFEMYKGTEKGFLTQRKNTHYDFVPHGNYQRRKDLLDPTDFLTKVV